MLNLNLFDQNFEEDPKKFGLTKGSVRIQINNVLSAICIAMVSILVGAKTHPLLLNTILSYLASAIPMLVTSSLLYSKICYRPSSEYKYWNGWAWTTHTLGYFLLIDSIFLLLFTQGFTLPSLMLLIVTSLLILVYSIMDVVAGTKTKTSFDRFAEKTVKLGFYLLIIFLGALGPLYLNDLI